MPISRRCRVLPFLLAVSLLACAESGPFRPDIVPPPEKGCSPGMLDTLYFGAAAGNRSVTAAEWERFLAESVTPRFPSGLTVIEGRGQWRGVNGVIGRETSRIVEIVHEDSPELREEIELIRSEYKERFRQESVLVIRSAVLACF